ncbi:unnamed protein product [Schistocephalus solidus]|uniref:GatB_N domain-containing protein n=1 Tax=Schistocephalus solidus TaxID=70667 RepID=A0A183S743_SCHSO|nr:unnamed protein product [Schistocephalus solidus]
MLPSFLLKLFLRIPHPCVRGSFNFRSVHCGGVTFVSTIGLEIHAQLTSVRTKLFSEAPYAFPDAQNTDIAPFDAAIPGSMPVGNRLEHLALKYAVILKQAFISDHNIFSYYYCFLPLLNRACVEAAVVAGLALNCQVNTTSHFERKHYFYADSPAGYQITQNLSPLAQNGWLDFLWSDGSPNSVQVSRASIRRIQLEQDTGKSLHDEKNGRSLIDLNRAGVGLIEIVTNPTFTCAAQTVAFVEELASLLSFLGVCSANMSMGELRVDVNVSIGPDLHNQGPVVEIKNVNSFHAIKNSVGYMDSFVLYDDGGGGDDDDDVACTFSFQKKQSDLLFEYC